MEDALIMKKYTKPNMETFELRVQECLAGPIEWADPSGDISGGGTGITLVAYNLGTGAVSSI